MIVPRTIRRMIAQIGNQLPVVVLPSVVPVPPSPSVGIVQHPGSHGYCASPSWNAQIIFGPDSVPVAGVIPGVTCAICLQFLPVYCGPQYVGPVVTYVFPVPQRPLDCSVYPDGHVFLTIVELVDVAQLEESPGMGKYPVGHVPSIYLELRFVF